MSLKSFFRKIGEFFANLFRSILPDLKVAIAIGVQVTEAIKNFDTATPWIGDLITRLIPGEWDDKVKVLIRANLPKIVIELKLVDATLGLTDPDEIVAEAIKTLQQMSGDYKSAFLNSLAIIIAQVASDGKLDWDDAVYLIKWFYDNKDIDDIDTTAPIPIQTA